jgi:hypothetical protein
MGMGKQGGIVKAPTASPMMGKKNGGKVVGGGMVKTGMTPKPVGGNSKKTK